MPTGEIVSIVADKGFGFIKPKDGTSDVFFHNSVLDCPIESVQLGQRVEFELDEAAEKARAKSVRVAGGTNASATTASGTATRPGPSRLAGRTEFGFVTKMVWKKEIGFISADAGGAELKFEPADVAGEKPFQKIKVGDYVRFERNAFDATKNPLIEAPTVKSVEVIERVPKKLPRIGLPKNPKARRKKPTWR